MKYFENFFLEGQVCSNERPFLSNRGYLIIALRIMEGGGLKQRVGIVITLLKLCVFLGTASHVSYEAHHHESLVKMLSHF